jgi:hypothetical protein
MVILVGPLLALMQIIPVAVMGMSQGKQQSIAAFLAEQKMERIKAWAMSTATNPVQQGFDTVAAGSTCFTAVTGPCQTEDYNTIGGYPGYKGTATITPGPIANTTQVVVTVFFYPVTAVGVSTSESGVQLSTFIAK